MIATYDRSPESRCRARHGDSMVGAALIGLQQLRSRCLCPWPCLLICAREGGGMAAESGTQLDRDSRKR